MQAKDFDGWTGLHFACKYAHTDVIQLLLEVGGCNVDTKDDNGDTGLHMACENGHADVVRLLVKYGCDVEAQDKNGKTGLHIACQFGHAQVIQTLLEAGCSLDTKDKSKRSGLDCSCIFDFRSDDVISLLIAYGCDFTTRHNDPRVRICLDTLRREKAAMAAVLTQLMQPVTVESEILPLLFTPYL